MAGFQHVEEAGPTFTLAGGKYPTIRKRTRVSDLVPLEKRHENDRSKDQANTHSDCNGDSQAFRSPDNLGHRFVIIRDEIED
ncbi:MAG: hypothetical protein EOS58_18325 [Mesorhizobium sp.]|uniref:hypothetical protein n=1 Tax=unclassified Mesorhizobium TaxID=325217 RepID=UPI000FCC93C4|nr:MULTISPECIES: hypothetical protein [unclassified Mesorhizobium]RUX45997.1 hypothetical protein EOA33_22510 [Mesorhizobium sp. M4A.F.Ca.ET.050.02.1.1]RVC45038.1 hypothetical protein EN781_11560 [Mesorhizobium sp. M4A.F.Ca.ET.090.04.2.1]RVD43823.1 hypothetical protein EN742_04010 [Mesorhizobium sp. M4A.F.Ca.ET.020.02.1.1]RWC13895.1 MAG: hypothetical protein EOS53_23445 [Mesorhizobium sp.]RWC54244.1 MAG: hypothetical protein EOS54_11065 [Mesorhizobium sp.]